MLSFWQNLKSDVIKTLKRSGSKTHKDPEELEKIKNTRKVAKPPIKQWTNTLGLCGNMLYRNFGDKVEDMISPAEWVDNDTARNTYRGTMVLASGRNSKKHGRKIVLVTTKKPYTVRHLPDMPRAVDRPGIMRTENHVYIIEGYSIDKDTTKISSNVNRLCLQSNEWEACPEMRSLVVDPITFIHKGYIYVIGSTYPGRYPKKGQRFNLETSEWSNIKDLPHGVYHCSASANVFKGRITIATRKRLMQYDEDADEWTVKTFKDLKRRPLLLILEGKLCACVRIAWWSRMFAKKVYDEEENVWLDNE